MRAFPIFILLAAAISAGVSDAKASPALVQFTIVDGATTTVFDLPATPTPLVGAEVDGFGFGVGDVYCLVNGIGATLNNLWFYNDSISGGLNDMSFFDISGSQYYSLSPDAPLGTAAESAPTFAFNIGTYASQYNAADGNVVSVTIAEAEIDTTWPLPSDSSAVPEPASLALLGLSLAGLGVARRRVAGARAG